MGGFSKDRWSGKNQLWWTGGQTGDKLVLEFEVPEGGRFDIQAVMTKALDYGIVQVSLDDERLGESIDLFNTPDVVTTGLVSLGSRELKSGKHQLAFEIKGKHPNAAPGFMFGLDFILLKPLAD
jgi:hypothetical protein